MDQQTTTAVPVQAPAKLSPVLDLIKKSLKIYKEGLKNFVGMAFIPALGGLPLVIVGGLFVLSSTYLDGIAQTTVNLVLGILGIAAFILMAAVYLLAKSGMILLVKNFESRQRVKEALLEGKKYIWPIFIVSLLVVVFVILWGLLFIIPGIIFAVYYSLAVYVLIIENQRGKAALNRSKELIKGYWWAVFGRYVVIGIVMFLVMRVFSIPGYFLEDNSLAEQIWNAVMTIIQLILSPISVIYAFLIFKELVGIKAQKNA